MKKGRSLNDLEESPRLLGIIRVSFSLENPTPKERKNTRVGKIFIQKPKWEADFVQPLEKRAFYLDKRAGIDRRTLHH